MNIKIKIASGKIKYIEYDTPINQSLEDGLYIGDLQIYTKIKDTKKVQCIKDKCYNLFDVKIDSKANIKYCKEHRRKRSKK